MKMLESSRTRAVTEVEVRRSALSNTLRMRNKVRSNQRRDKVLMGKWRMNAFEVHSQLLLLALLAVWKSTLV